MQPFHAIIAGIYRLVATWSVAGIMGGALILIAERWDARRRQVPSSDDVQRAADLYWQYYGPNATRVITDHIFGARLSGSRAHRDFLQRVAVVVMTGRDSEGPDTHEVEQRFC